MNLTRPIIISIAVISTVGIASAAYFQFAGTAGVTHILGQFFSDGTTGNAGRVSFGRGGDAGIEGNDLIGTFYIETIGVVTFNPDARIVPPASGRPTDLWSVVGTARSNAGPIYLAGVQYNPVTRSLVGHGINHGIGKIPFGVLTTNIDPVTGLPVTPVDSITNTTISIGFEGRVKVLGAIGGNSAFDKFYSPGTRFNASLYNDALNTVRKNVTLLIRNISFGSNTEKVVNNILFMKGNILYSDIKTDYQSSIVSSLIVIGGDLIIDTDIINTTNMPKGIIVMKDDIGNGGNIIVQGNVKRIQSSIFAEGSLYSGDDKNALYNDTPGKILTLPENQLYIQGSLISRNTIGGATQSYTLCIYSETTCTPAQAIRYDLNYFRLTPPTRDSADPTTRAYSDDSLDAYSLIIERDHRIVTDPPPGF